MIHLHPDNIQVYPCGCIEEVVDLPIPDHLVGHAADWHQYTVTPCGRQHDDDCEHPIAVAYRGGAAIMEAQGPNDTDAT